MSTVPGEKPEKFTRRDVTAMLVRRTGMTYAEASKTYTAIVDLISDAIVTGRPISFGHVLTLKVVQKPARRVNNGLTTGTNSKLYLGARKGVKAVLHRSFMKKHFGP